MEELTTQVPRGILNCHGCKWLDRYKRDGNGYCCMVELSSQKHDPRCKERFPDKERCELYEEGNFATRYKGKINFVTSRN